MGTKIGLVAIMNEAGDAIIEIRDVGPDPVPVKQSRVKTFEEIKPDLAEGEQYDGFDDQIMTTKVKRVWSVIPIPVVVPEVISDRQFFQMLATPPYALITQEEALAAVKTGDIPVAMLTILSGMPEGEKFKAEMLLSGATEFRRSNALVTAFGLAMGWTTEQIDGFWIGAAKL